MAHFARRVLRFRDGALSYFGGPRKVLVVASAGMTFAQGHGLRRSLGGSIEGRATALLSTRASLSHAKYLLVPASLLRTPALAARRALAHHEHRAARLAHQEARRDRKSVV